MKVAKPASPMPAKSPCRLRFRTAASLPCELHRSVSAVSPVNSVDWRCKGSMNFDTSLSFIPYTATLCREGAETKLKKSEVSISMLQPPAATSCACGQMRRPSLLLRASSPPRDVDITARPWLGPRNDTTSQRACSHGHAAPEPGAELLRSATDAVRSAARIELFGKQRLATQGSSSSSRADDLRSRPETCCSSSAFVGSGLPLLLCNSPAGCPRCATGSPAATCCACLSSRRMLSTPAASSSASSSMTSCSLPISVRSSKMLVFMRCTSPRCCARRSACDKVGTASELETQCRLHARRLGGTSAGRGTGRRAFDAADPALALSGAAAVAGAQSWRSNSSSAASVRSFSATRSTTSD
mmetsp:Transcript_60369/g.143875  ORF Transcript_60369/g.143875 Transcript_60369/m.143875 type:complete len:357 (+) Transcript_60369:648-1718(+)